MMRNIIVRPEAAREVQSAFDWYEEKSEGLGLEFLLGGRRLSGGRAKNAAGLFGST